MPLVDFSALPAAVGMPVRPGDSLQVTIDKAGEGRRQGVGYLEDGSLVVVSDAEDRIGSRVRCTVLRTHQTAQGRMIFAEIDAA